MKTSTSMKNHAAYIYDNAIGYENVNITGYDLYVIDGQHYITYNNALKFVVMPQKIVKLNWFKKWDKINKPHFTIYAKLLFDSGYVWQEHYRERNDLSNRFVFGSGVGVDLVTYYDIVISVGYAINSRGKTNFFFGFKAPIF